MNWTIQTASRAMRAGELTPSQLLEECLERIAHFEPKIQAWVLVAAEEAREQARILTEELRQNQSRGPLHGIPIGVKDIFDVADWPTSAGSRRWAQSIARKDCTVVARLRQAGAVLVGKTVTTAYASFDPPPTRNPWNLDRTPGGSSSGSAAAVAAGMCLGALASQTGGSTLRPGAYCGVPAFKPTWGRVSVQGVVPLAPSLDHVGLIGRNARDLAIMLEAIAGADPLDPTCSEDPVPDLTWSLPSVPNPLRIGRLRGFFDERATNEITASINAFVERLVAAQTAPAEAEEGRFPPERIEVYDLTPPVGFSRVIPLHRTIMAVEAAQFHRERLKKYPSDYPPNITALLNEGIAAPATHYAEARQFQADFAEAIDALFVDYDVLLTPATTTPAPEAKTTGDPAFQSPWSLSGHPTINLPIGWSADGLPLSVQLIGRRGWEDEFFSIAIWIEQQAAFATRPLPTYS